MPLRQILSHNGLRGLAALLVVFYHLQFGASYLLPVETASLFFKRSYLLVDLFFVLSGFIISYTNGADRSIPMSGEQVWKFLSARVARVYPLHLFCLVYLAGFWMLATVLGGITGKPLAGDHWSAESVGYLILQLSLLQALSHAAAESWNIPSWSISAELFAYLLFPLLVLIHARSKMAGRLLLLTIPALFYGTVLLTSGSLDIIAGWALLRCLSGFSLGMMIFHHRHDIERLGNGVLAIVQIAAVAVILGGLALAWNDVVLVPAFAALVATTWEDRGPVVRFLRLRPIQYLGEISYSVYLNHVCILQIVGFAWARVMPHLIHSEMMLRIGWIGFAIAATVFVSSLTYRFIERPARQYLFHRLAGRWAFMPDTPTTAP